MEQSQGTAHRPRGHECKRSSLNIFERKRTPGLPTARGQKPKQERVLTLGLQVSGAVAVEGGHVPATLLALEEPGDCHRLWGCALCSTLETGGVGPLCQMSRGRL